MPRTRSSRLASLLPARSGVFAHRVTVLETGERLERAVAHERVRAGDHRPLHMEVSETRMPWAWLRIEVGPHRSEEYRVEGDLMALVRPGHALVVVFEDRTGRPLLVENLATGQRYEDDDPHPLRTGNGPFAWLRMVLVFAFLGAVLLTVPLAIPWLWLSTSVIEAFGGRVHQEQAGALLTRTPLVCALLAALAVHLYDAHETRRRAARRPAILRAAAAARAGWDAGGVPAGGDGRPDAELAPTHAGPLPGRPA